MLGTITRRGLLRLLPAAGAGVALLAACTPPAPPSASGSGSAAKPTEAPKPAAPTTAPAPAATAAESKPAVQAPPAAQAPAQAGQPITLKLQSGWGSQDIVHEVFMDLGKKIEEMAGGRLKVDILPNGAVVGAFQIIDAVHQGVLDGGHGVPAYWFGKNRAASLFGTGPSFGMDANTFLAWIRYGGGQELYDELIQKILGLNVVSFFHGPIPTQPLGWFKEEIKSPDQLKGLKYRTVGMSADLFKEMGASVVILAGTEIVPALERGVIDAAEWNNTTSDKILGFPDVRKIYMLQSYHQPAEFLELLMNKQKYESLPKDLQAVVKYAAMAQSADMSWKFTDRNSKDYIELTEQRNVKVFKTPKSVLDAELNAWDKLIADETAKDPFFAKIVKSQRDFAARVVPWQQDITVEGATAYNHFFKK